MKRKEDRPLSKHTIFLYADAMNRLKAIHGSRIGASRVVRLLVDKHLRRVDEIVAEGKSPHVSSGSFDPSSPLFKDEGL